MTFDEAIKRFSDNAEYERTHGSLQGCLEFRQLAEWLTELKELKEHTDPCDDCISRQAVLDELERCHITSGVKNQGTWNECVDSIMRTIGFMPSVQPQGLVHIDDIYRLISGHSNYHGDNILAALTCLAEGEEVQNPITILSVQPEPKTGHWIKEETIYGWDGKSYQCSCCGRSIHLDTVMEDLDDYLYCHCGAKMESGGKE